MSISNDPPLDSRCIVAWLGKRVEEVGAARQMLIRWSLRHHLCLSRPRVLVIHSLPRFHFFSGTSSLSSFRRSPGGPLTRARRQPCRVASVFRLGARDPRSHAPLPSSICITTSSKLYHYEHGRCTVGIVTNFVALRTKLFSSLRHPSTLTIPAMATDFQRRRPHIKVCKLKHKLLTQCMPFRNFSCSVPSFFLPV